MIRVSILYVVGLGPGNKNGITFEAYDAIVTSEAVLGYKTYVNLLDDIFVNNELSDKDIISNGMRQEKDRCIQALELADSGKCVSLICSGDSGVYGMASLALELLPDYTDVEIRIVPGVSAAISGAAVLGAPIGHDFAVISLSDLLTEWSVIEKRLACAAAGDFCICLYNPSSHKRSDYLQKACDVILEHKSGETVCGYVRNIGREGQESRVLSLEELREQEVDMFTTVFIGSQMTRFIGNKMVTPRGYRNV